MFKINYYGYYLSEGKANSVKSDHLFVKLKRYEDNTIKFSPSIRGIFSIQNELIQDNNSNSPWTSNIKSLLSQGFAINLTFE